MRLASARIRLRIGDKGRSGTLILSEKKKIAFACSGGAVKAAAFHVGVAMALEQKGFLFLGGSRERRAEEGPFNPSKTIQSYVGSSAGSLVATFLAQGGKLKDLVASFRQNSDGEGVPGIKYWEVLFPRIRSPLEIFSPDNFIMNMLRKATLQSPFSTDGIARYLRNHVIETDRFSDLEADLFVVATELLQSKKVVFGKYKSAIREGHLEYRNDVGVCDACAASMALPPIYHPYRIQIEGEARDYYDGEILEPLSNHVARDSGADLIICSYTHQPLNIPKGRMSPEKWGVHTVTLQALYQVIEQKIIRSRGQREKEKNLLDYVAKFFAEKGLDDNLADELIAKLEARMSYKSDVHYIYIHPRPSDIEMFIAPSFSLNRKKTESIVRRGFVAGMTALRNVDLEA